MNRNRVFRSLCAVLLPALALLASPGFAADDAASAVESDARTPIHQLRIYEFFDDTREAFHDRFRDHAAWIMAKYDFDIVAIWESRNEGRLEFVYLLQWPDEATMTDRWARFMADPEWAEIKRETRRAHGRFVGAIEQRTLRSTAYSPTTAFPKRVAKQSPESTSLTPVKQP